MFGTIHGVFNTRGTGLPAPNLPKKWVVQTIHPYGWCTTCFTSIQWIALRENLPEAILFTMKYMGVL